MTSPNDLPAPNNAADDDLQFDVAEPTRRAGAAAAMAAAPCAACGRPISSEYYAVGTKPICSSCAAQVNAAPSGSRASRLGLATLYGVGAAILGAIIWYAIRRVTHMEIGYIAILVGFLVGRAVRKGSGNRGGRAYQILALILTYCSIAGNYAPDVIKGIVDEVHNRQTSSMTDDDKTDAGVRMAAPAKKDASVAARNVTNAAPDLSKSEQRQSLLGTLVGLALLVVLVAGISLAAPFLGGLSNVIGLLIIGFALFQAWKMNRARRLAITGPFKIGPPGVGASV